MLDKQVQAGRLTPMNASPFHGFPHFGQILGANQYLSIARGPDRSLLHLCHPGTYRIVTNNRATYARRFECLNRLPLLAFREYLVQHFDFRY